MSRLVRVELLKLRTVRTTYGLLVAAALLTAFLAGSRASKASLAGSGNHASASALSSQWLLPLFSLGLGIVVFVVSFAQSDPRATAVAGLVVLVTLIVAWLVATARGQNGHPYDWLLATSGLSYLLAIAFFRWRG
jgi:cobalamin synthase